MTFKANLPTVMAPQPGLFVSSAGNLFYLTGENTTTRRVCRAYRSTDGGSTWNSGVDTTLNSTNDTSFYMSADQVGDTLYVGMYLSFYQSGMGDDLVDLEYREFDMSTNAWTNSQDSVSTAINLGTQASSAVISTVRRAADTVLMYRMDDGNYMGGAKRVYGYARGTAGSWANVDIAISPVDANWHHATYSAQGSQSNDVHFIIGWDATTSNPVDDEWRGRTLRGDNTLSSIVQINTTDAFSANINDASRIPLLAFSDSGGTYRIMESTGAASVTNVQRFGEDASDDIASGDTYTDINDMTTTQPGRGRFAKDGNTVYCVFLGTGDDLYYETSTDGSPSGFGNQTEIEDGIDIITIYGVNIFTHASGNGGDKVLGYLVNDGGTFKYGETVLEGAFPPPFRRPRQAMRVLKTM